MNRSTEQMELIEQILFPHAREQRTRILEAKGHFVHYTTAEGAEGILKNRSVWLRSTTCMNDYTEVLHGYGCFRTAWLGDSGKALQAALNKCHPDIAEEAARNFDKITGGILHGSFVACFSEHDPREDRHGRLSMWRAYCNPSGVALVLNHEPFFLRSDALKAYSSPVAYLDDREFVAMVERIAAGIEAHRDMLATIDRQAMIGFLTNVFRFAILCTKHPAFAEEREWRVTYTPALVESPVITRSVRTVRGVVQPVYELPLKDIPGEGLVGIEIPSLVHKVIIGPTQYGTATHSALWWLLHEAGIANPAETIVSSGVPLRT